VEVPALRWRLVSLAIMKSSNIRKNKMLSKLYNKNFIWLFALCSINSSEPLIKKGGAFGTTLLIGTIVI
jgi:hypothetical protein